MEKFAGSISARMGEAELRLDVVEHKLKSIAEKLSALQSADVNVVGARSDGNGDKK